MLTIQPESIRHWVRAPMKVFKLSPTSPVPERCRAEDGRASTVIAGGGLAAFLTRAVLDVCWVSRPTQHFARNQAYAECCSSPASAPHIGLAGPPVSGDPLELLWMDGASKGSKLGGCAGRPSVAILMEYSAALG
jgi:hypothetical protein